MKGTATEEFAQSTPILLSKRNASPTSSNSDLNEHRLSVESNTKFKGALGRSKTAKVHIPEIAQEEKKSQSEALSLQDVAITDTEREFLAGVGPKSRENVEIATTPMMRSRAESKGKPSSPGLPSRKNKNPVYRLFNHSSHEYHSEATFKIKLNDPVSLPDGISRSDSGEECLNTNLFDEHIPTQKSERSRANSVLAKIFHFNDRHEILSPAPSSDATEDPFVLSMPSSSSSSPHKNSSPENFESGMKLSHSYSFNVFKSHKFQHSEEHSSPNLLKDLHLKKHSTAKEDEEDNTPLASRGSPASSKGMIKSGSELEKYGKIDQVLGKGANAVVKLAHQKVGKMKKEKYYAIKEFRKRRKDESQREFVKKLMAEFCIRFKRELTCSSSLHHDNIVETIDLIHDEHNRYCEVMEFLAGGDLYTRISKSTLSDPDEINCYFKQLINGVSYLHSVGVAHR